MKKMNRILAILLAAAILIGFYVPTAAQAAAVVESLVWEFDDAVDLADWTRNKYWTGTDGILRASFDSYVTSNTVATCNRGANWKEYDIAANVTVYPQGSDGDYSRAALITCVGGMQTLELRMETTVSGTFIKTVKTKAILYVKDTSSGTAVMKQITTKTLDTQWGGSSGDPINHTLALKIRGTTAEAVVDGTSIITYTMDTATYPDLLPGGLQVMGYRAYKAEAANEVNDIIVDVNSVSADIYSFYPLNDTNNMTDPITYTDSFSEAEGKSPDYWIEDSGVDQWAVAASPSAAAAEGCNAPSGNAYKYTGTGYARTWLHVFETNVHYTVKAFVPEGTTTGKIGLITRMTGLNVPAISKVGYDFDQGVWFAESGKGALEDYGALKVKSAAGTFEPGKWHLLRAVVIDRVLQLYCDGTLVLTASVDQITGGRVGMFAEGVSEAYFDDVNLKLVSGQSRVEQAVLANYAICDGEGGAIFVYDENTLIFNMLSGILYKSTDNGMTFTKIATTDPEYDIYKHLAQSPRTQYIRLHDGSILKLASGDMIQGGTARDYTAYLYSADGSEVTRGGVLYNLMQAGNTTIGGDGQYAAYYSGGMNEMLKEINLGDIDGDGEDNYRVYHCADVRTTGNLGNSLDYNSSTGKYSESIRYHWQEVYYSDDKGMTWEKADLDTRWLSGLDHVCESRIMPVYNDDGSLYCIRMFSTWNDGRSVRYFDSFDYGKTWSTERAFPELSGGRNSYAYAIDYETGYIYLTYLYGEPEADDSIYPRSRLVLLRSKDATKWEYLMDVWRWDDVPDDSMNNVNQAVDPSLTINGDYIYVTAGWSEKVKVGAPHNDLKQTLVVLDKTKLSAYEAFPEAFAADNDIVYVEVTAPKKLLYTLGDELDLSGGYLTVHYFDGTTKKVDLTDASVTLERPDVDWLWTSEFSTTDYPLTGKRGVQWIRAEYIEPDRDFNDGFVDGFYIYVGETEEDIAHVLFDSAEDEFTWTGSHGKVEGDKFAVEFETSTAADAVKNSTINLNIDGSAKWSGYTTVADFSVYEQTSGYYSNFAWRVGMTANDYYEIRFTSASAEEIRVQLYTKAGAVDAASRRVKFNTALTPNADGSLPIRVTAQFVNNQLVLAINGVTADVNANALVWDVDRMNGDLGMFVYRPVSGDGTVKVTLDHLKVTAPTVRNFYDAALEDKISLNIHMGITNAVAQDKGIFMKFILNGVQSIVNLAQATAGENNDLAFTVHIAAKEMADTITAQLYNGNNEIIAEHTTTLKDYADYIIKTNGYEQRYKDIAQAMLNYGAAAQLHFKHNTENLANGGFAAGWNSNVDMLRLANYVPRYEGALPEGVTFYGSSLIMEDRTTIRHYFKMDAQVAANVQVSLFGQPLKLVQSGRFYYVDITGVDAANLDYFYTVEMTDGENVFSVSYSALSYVYQILSMEDYNGTTMAQLAQALYLYHRAVTLEPEIGGDEFEVLPF